MDHCSRVSVPWPQICFSALRDTRFFETVHIGSHGQIQWTEDLELCPEAAYQELKDRISTEVGKLCSGLAAGSERLNCNPSASFQ